MFDPEDFFTGEDDSGRDQFLTSLHHIHLPKLEGAGYIDRDPRATTISRGPDIDDIEPLLRALSTRHHDWLKPR